MSSIAYNTPMHPAREEITVYDEPEACPYLPGQTARLPLRMPLRKLTPAELDARLAAGDRRSGTFLYTTACAACQACEPIRLDLQTFVPSRTQQRVWKRGQALFQLEVRTPRIDDERIALFNEHRQGRGLDHDRENIDAFGYEQFLANSCCDTWEFAYYLEDRLVMIAIVDRGATASSAVYTYFTPSVSQYSPGVYSIMQEMEVCRAWGQRYLYLGYFVAGSRHMAYKATYRPHERKLQGQWQVVG